MGKEYYGRLLELSKVKMVFHLVIIGILFNHSAYCQTQRIRRGSILEIRVYGYEELSRTVMVQPDGTIDYPLISNIPVDGYSLDDLREILKVQASKYMEEIPIISVKFSQTMNVGVIVLGQVMVPGEYMVAKRATVQGAITRAGGTTPRAQLNRVKLIRNREDSTHTILVDLYQFYIDGDPNLLPSLEDGDIIVVPGLPGTYDVKVIGEVKTPGTYQIFTGANLLDAIYMAGGPTEGAGLNKIRLVSPFAKSIREIEIDIESLLQANQMIGIPELKPGDIVYVPTKNKFWRGFIAVIRDITAIILPIALILYYTRVLER